jgi:putative endonuclease
MSRWHVYILRCGDASLYTGISTNVEARVQRHAAGRGAAYTRSHLPVTLIWTQAMDSESAARKREAEIKRWTRQQKLDLVLQGHPKEPRNAPSSALPLRSTSGTIETL